MVFLKRLERFLKENCGLEPSQVPHVIGTFVGLKYVVWSGFAVVGARYQPVSRFLVRKLGKMQMPKGAEKARKAFNDGYIEQKYKIVKDEPSSWFVRLGRSYQHHTSNLADRVSQNALWIRVSQSIRQDPRYLAVGLAEGMILYKLFIPIHIPLTLYFIVLYYRERADLLNKETEKEEENVEGAFETLRGLGMIATQEREESVLTDIKIVQESRGL